MASKRFALSHCAFTASIYNTLFLTNDFGWLSKVANKSKYSYQSSVSRLSDMILSAIAHAYLLSFAVNFAIMFCIQTRPQIPFIFRLYFIIFCCFVQRIMKSTEPESISPKVKRDTFSPPPPLRGQGRSGNRPPFPAGAASFGQNLPIADCDFSVFCCVFLRFLLNTAHPQSIIKGSMDPEKIFFFGGTQICLVH